MIFKLNINLTELIYPIRSRMKPQIKQVQSGVWEFKEGEMKVPGRIYATEKLFDDVEDGVFKQIANVAQLPGIQKFSLAMPDAHYGYGFPIGGVAAFDFESGVISPGGVGYDINCGVRLLSTNLTTGDIKPKLKILMDKLFDAIPSGLGSKGRLRASQSQLDSACIEGAKWAVREGYGIEDDLEHIEENGAISGTDPNKVSNRAKERGRPQFGTLGSGNHFLEIQRVDKIFNPEIAKKFGINNLDQITIMVHCGSRGFGYQVADDYIKIMLDAARKYNIKLADKELACAPLKSKEANDYLAAMRCAVNYAFANRQVITHWIREVFTEVLPDSKLDLVYDVCHNVAKIEKHIVDGTEKELCVHRKGATRAFSSGRPEIPKIYRDVGQPVIIPGDMGTASYVLVGTQKAMEETFGSTCHGAGRVMSRAGAIRKTRGEDVLRKLQAKGEVIKAASMKVLAEEMPEAYKDIDEVIRSVELTEISKPIVRMTPLGVAKG